MTIFIVIGTQGEYSDRAEWIVCAYMKEDDAKVHVQKATEYANCWISDYSQPANNPLDPDSERLTYSDTRYWYEPVEVKEQFVSPESIQ